MIEPIVKLDNGFVRGLVEKHEEGFEFYSFKKVPFAEPPVGELRFQDPLPKKKWSGIIDCTTDVPTCLQYDFVLNVDSYEEDCLYLNVFTRSINQPNKRSPVIMVVHTGVFVYGKADSSLNGPNYLMRKDVVLVMPNYRLGILGFLDLQDEIAPGNQGLKDLVLALEWIQQNIEKFGGDPNNVTVFGPCGAGTAAHYLAISPLTKGLMHKVISAGSVVYNTWAAVADPRSNAIKFCSLLGKNLTDPKEIFNFLKSLDAQCLQETQKNLRQFVGNFTFGPGVDSKSAKPFLPINRYEAADQGVNLPYLVGYNSHDSGIVLSGMTKEDIFNMANVDFKYLLALNAQDILNHHNLHKNQIRRLYYKNEAVSMKNIDLFLEFSNDFTFFEGVHRFIKVQAEKSTASTYFYQFSYIPPHTTTQYFTKDVDDKYKRTSGHFEHLPFLFNKCFINDLGYPALEKGSRDYRMMEQMTEMWTNFARYGKPTINNNKELIPFHWKPINNGTVLRYLNIDTDITMQTTINVEQKLLSAKDIQV